MLFFIQLNCRYSFSSDSEMPTSVTREVKGIVRFVKVTRNLVHSVIQTNGPKK